MEWYDWIVTGLVLAGALTWGSIAVANLNPIAWLAAKTGFSWLENFLYILVGISAVYSVVRLIWPE